ncbi:MAG TPA: hypothetical protein VGQ38_15260 [Gaiellaceae bacterium]|jgi:hypothetical protein|nr:hypothetical protein [Gaiellaceae bacterium]
MKTPVALFVFNRPDVTARVIEAVRVATPPLLLVVADGPRPGVPSDEPACREVRALIDRAGWPCPVRTNYADANLGCRARVSSGIDWVFDEVPEAVLLEDDTLPDPTFFRFADELLERYREDHRVMSISGDNFQRGRRRGSASYYFSRYSHIWGWGTWRRAWSLYDRDLTRWPALRAGGWLADVLRDQHEIEYWTDVFDRVARGEVDTWDYAWLFTCWVAGGLTALPNRNLVTNIGFVPDATHTSSDSRLANLPTKPMEFPLVHPASVTADAAADAFTGQTVFRKRRLRRVARQIRGYLRTAQR